MVVNMISFFISLHPPPPPPPPPPRRQNKKKLYLLFHTWSIVLVAFLINDISILI